MLSVTCVLIETEAEDRYELWLEYLMKKFWQKRMTTVFVMNFMISERWVVFKEAESDMGIREWPRADLTLYFGLVNIYITL